MVSNIWNKNIPVEKSSYLCDNDITFFNLDGFKHDKNKLTMIDLFCGAGGFSVALGRDLNQYLALIILNLLCAPGFLTIQMLLDG